MLNTLTFSVEDVKLEDVLALAVRETHCINPDPNVVVLELSRVYVRVPIDLLIAPLGVFKGKLNSCVPCSRGSDASCLATDNDFPPGLA